MRIADGQNREAHLQKQRKPQATLTEQQKEISEKFKDFHSEPCDITARQAFTDRFILASRIMVEVMEGMETVAEI